MHFSSVIGNLLENSIKYSGEDVYISVSQKGDSVYIGITDNGIAAGEVHHVFDKFYRCRSVVQSMTPGIGLGLSYVQLIMKAHHGSVTLRSKQMKGTTVTLIMPINNK